MCIVIDSPEAKSGSRTDTKYKEDFVSAVSQFIVPMLNAELDLDNNRISTPRESPVALLGSPVLLALKPQRLDLFRIVLKRKQPFSAEERDLCEKFCDDFSRISKLNDSDFHEEILAGIGTRLVANYLDKGPVKWILNTLIKWSSQTYEGRPITACVGIDSARATSDAPQLIDIVGEDYVKVLSNGYDTILSINGRGKILELSKVEHEESYDLFSPYRLNGIAKWSNEKNRIAIALNQHGQIFVFAKGSLVFALRAGEWLYFAHDNVITRMSPSKNTELKNQIYKSCLDTSFARVGGCIALLRRNVISDDLKKLVSSQDIIKELSSSKSKVLNTIINNNKFQELNRSVRLEILSMDGATILDHDGTILAAGAIVEVPAGSTGGGRRAAAIALSELGMAIKVSADGGISGFSKKDLIFEA